MPIDSSAGRFSKETAGDVSSVEALLSYRFTTSSFAAALETTIWKT